MQDKIIVFPKPSPDGNAQLVTPGLPVSLTSLIGREQEVQALHSLLLRSDVRLLTLIGTAGVGKTRLALEVVPALASDFADGVYLVSLAPLRDPAFVIPTIAHCLGLTEGGPEPLLDRLKASQRDKQRLLLLDNFEHVIAASPLLVELLEACPNLKLLVTSREVLHLRGEHQFVILPLALPDPKHLSDVHSLAHVPAVSLFLQRARAIRSDFQLTSDNAATVAQICVRLDGLPLAIELAAARIRLLPPQALLARLDQRLHVLTSGGRDAPVRQQTLRQTLDWSYHLLDAEEQKLFRVLSIFQGGCTLEALEALGRARGEETDNVLDRVASLIDKSLLQQVAQEGKELRFVMLETIREYGREALAACGEAEETQRAHAAYYLALAEDIEPRLIGAGKQRWLARLQREHENLRVASAWLAEHHEQEAALRLCGALWRFWWMRGYLSEGRAELTRVLAGSREVVATPVRAKALHAAGILAVVQGDLEQVSALCGEGLTLFRTLGDRRGSADCLSRLGSAAWQRSDFAIARSVLEEAITLYREVDDKNDITFALVVLALVFLYQGEYERARTLIEEAAVLDREAGDSWNIANSQVFLATVVSFQGDFTRAHTLLEEIIVLARGEGYKEALAYALFVSGNIALQQGDYATARAQMEEDLALSKTLGDRHSTANSLTGLAAVSFAQGDYAAAYALFEESLALFQEMGNRWLIAIDLVGLGAVAAAQGAWTWAARLSGATEALCLAIHGALPPAARVLQEFASAAARAQLGEDIFTAAWAEGHTMTPEQALVAQGPVTMPIVAPAGTSSAPHARKALPPPEGLTAREVEVLQLVAQGLTDAQIARSLVISPHTVNSHLKSIYGKIQVTSRAAATRYAIEHQIV